MKGKFRKLYLFALYLLLAAIVVIAILTLIAPTEGAVFSQISR